MCHGGATRELVGCYWGAGLKPLVSAAVAKGSWTALGLQNRARAAEGEGSDPKAEVVAEEKIAECNPPRGARQQL